VTLARHALDDLLAPTTVADRLARLRTEGLADETGLTFVGGGARPRESEGRRRARRARRSGGVQHPDLLARSRYLRARVLAEPGGLDAALRLIEQARAGWWSAGSLLPALRTDLGRMQVLGDLGRHREAAAVGVELLVALEGVVDYARPNGSAASPTGRSICPPACARSAWCGAESVLSRC
jgi:hypothetical protein